jgi:hypothetical protein
MSIFIRPFIKSDLTAFEPMEPMTRNSRFNPELAQAMEDSGLAITGIREGKIFGCGGVHPLSNGQGEIWLRLSQDCLKHKLDTLRWIREGLKIIEEVYPFNQLNAVVKCCFASSIKLVKFLGFHETQTEIYDGESWLIFSKRVKK